MTTKNNKPKVYVTSGAILISALLLTYCHTNPKQVQLPVEQTVPLIEINTAPPILPVPKTPVITSVDTKPQAVMKKITVDRVEPEHNYLGVGNRYSERKQGIDSTNNTKAVKIIIKKISDTTDGENREFINRIMPIALQIQAETGIPASALIGQAIFETNYGKSSLAKANNFFGIKALDSKWDGEVVWKVTRDYDKTVTHNQPFRKYNGVYDGFIGYYYFLKHSKRYDNVWNKKSGVDFISAIANAGYCPDSDYVELIEKIIKRHKLYLLEQAV